MKKLSVVCAVVLVAGIAYASSLAIPWFVDNAALASGWPPSAGVTTLIYLKNNLPTPLDCTIKYFSEDGLALGPPDGSDGFTIPAQSTVAFRPVAYDPSTAGGQESAVALLIPDRPRDVDIKKNGSATVAWEGANTDVQGICVQMGIVSSKAFSFGHLLPPGA